MKKGSGVVLVLLLQGLALAQISSTSAAQAAVLAQLATAALTGGNAVADATLTGTVTWFAGSSTDQGTVTLKAKGTGESRIDLALSSHTFSHITNNASSNPQCWSGTTTSSYQLIAAHNCWTDASWFFPALTSLFANPAENLAYVGQEFRDGITVQHLQAQREVSGQRPKATSLIAKLSTVDYYVASGTNLPLAIAFKTHPENDLNINIAVEVRFADYRAINGVQIPFRIQKLINGGLNLDITLTNAVVNSGLRDTEFVAQ